MSDPSFVSYAQNGEDVVLWRALGGIADGCYVDVGANDPVQDSVTRAFYERGWRGIDIEPILHDAQRLREDRPGDVVVRAAVTAAPVDDIVLYEVTGTGLSTLDPEIAGNHRLVGLEVREVSVPTARLDDILAEHLGDGREVHFLKLDVEGAESDVLATLDLTRWRPWVLVVEATRPNSTEPTHGEWEPELLKADYQLCLFDGLSRFYVAAEHAAKLGRALSYPACVLDDYITLSRHEAALTTEQLRHDVLRWRGAALRTWARAASRPTDYDQLVARAEEVRALRHELGLLRADLAHARTELRRHQQTLSWRVTKPLRTVQRLRRSANRE